MERFNDIGPVLLAVFAIATFVLTATPGPGVL